MPHQGRLAGFRATAQSRDDPGHDTIACANDVYFAAHRHGRDVLAARTGFLPKPKSQVFRREIGVSGLNVVALAGDRLIDLFACRLVAFVVK